MARQGKGQLALLAPLRHRLYRFLFAGEVISDLGDWLDYLALITLIVYRWQLGPGALAALSLAQIVPRLVVAPIAGVWADRLPRKTVMILCDLARVPIVLALIWAPNLPVLLLLVAFKGVFSTLFNPAWQAAIRMTVPKEDLLAANSLSQLSLQATKVLGPALGGVLVTVAGPRGAFLVDALSFLASASFLAFLPRLAPPPRGEEAEEQHFWVELQTGLTYIVRNHALAVAIISMAGAMFLIFTFDSLAALALKELGVGESLLGLVVGAVGLGTALGATAIGQYGERLHPLRIMGLGDLAGGALVALVGGVLLLGLGGAQFGLIPVWLLVGFAGAAMFVPYGYVLQRATPSALIGRVASTASTVQTAFQLLAPPLGAVLAARLGVGFVFAMAGAALVALGAGVALLGPRLARKFDVEEAEEAEEAAADEPLPATAAEAIELMPRPTGWAGVGTAQQAAGPAQPPHPAWLEVLPGEWWPLKHETLIGRNRQNDIRLPDPSVSRYHAIIRYTDGQYLVVDLASTNGTSVNGSAVSRAQELRPGDRIEFGDVDATFQSAAAGAALGTPAVSQSSEH